MKDEIANLVYPVINKGLLLQEQVRQGRGHLDAETEQAELRSLLLSENAAKRWSDYGGDGTNLDVSVTPGYRPTDAGRRTRESFLGIRYVLTCWLDEIMVDSPWGEWWKEHTLEHQLYGVMDRADEFYSQLKRAETRSGSDALEVFYLAVMLGFRGRFREDPDALRDKVKDIPNRIAQSLGREWPAPDGTEPVTNVPPLRGRDRHQKMTLAWGAAALVTVLFVAFFLVSRFWAN
jgi:type VI secretion system protein ImpK